MYLRLDLIKKVLYNENMDTYFALAEPTRREIIELLARKGELPASDIYRKFKVSAPAISQHLKELKNAGLIQGTIEGTSVCYCIDPKTWKHYKTAFEAFFVAFENGSSCC